MVKRHYTSFNVKSQVLETEHTVLCYVNKIVPYFCLQIPYFEEISKFNTKWLVTNKISSFNMFTNNFLYLKKNVLFKNITLLKNKALSSLTEQRILIYVSCFIFLKWFVNKYLKTTKCFSFTMNLLHYSRTSLDNIWGRMGGETQDTHYIGHFSLNLAHGS